MISDEDSEDDMSRKTKIAYDRYAKEYIIDDMISEEEDSDDDYSDKDVDGEEMEE